MVSLAIMTEQTPPPTSRLRPPTRRPSTLQVVLLVILAIGLPLALDFRRRIELGQSVAANRNEMESVITDLEARQEQLNAERTFVSSDTFVEAWAHNQGKLVREGERLVIPVPQGEPILEQRFQQPPSQPIPSWQVWWSLFFDGDPPF